MKTIRTLLVISIAILFTSCQKDYSDGLNAPGTPGASSKVKTYTEDVTAGGNHVTATFNIAYDGDNKIISMTSAASAGDRFEYHYAGGRYSRDLYNSNKLSIHEDFFLNSIPSVDSTFQYNDTGDSTTEKYIYNAAKQLITVKQYDYSLATGADLSDTQHFTYDSRGNVIKLTDDYTVTTYEYYPNLLNNLAFGLPYSPNSKDLVKTTTYFDGSTVTINHVYTFDAANRISTETATSDDGDVATKTYTYY